MIFVSQEYLDLYNGNERRARYRFSPVEGAASSISTTITDEDLESGRLEKGFCPLETMVVGIVYQGSLDLAFYRDRMGRDAWLSPPIEAGQCFQLEHCFETIDGTEQSPWITLFTGWVSEVDYLSERGVWSIKAVDSCYFLGQMFASDPKWETKLITPTTFADLYAYINVCLQQVIRELGLWAYHLPPLLIHGNSEIKDIQSTAFRDIIANTLIVSGVCMRATPWGGLENAEILLEREPYVMPDPTVVFDAEISAYTVTLVRVGVTNGTESWLYPETEGRFQGAFKCVYSMFSPYANKWHAEVMWGNLGGYEHRKWKFRSAALPLHLEPEDLIRYTDEYGVTHDLMIGYMSVNLSADPETTCGLGRWVTSVEIASNGEVAFHGASASAITGASTAIAEGGNRVILDHIPTPEEIDTIPDQTLIYIRDAASTADGATGGIHEILTPSYVKVNRFIPPPPEPIKPGDDVIIPAGCIDITDPRYGLSSECYTSDGKILCVWRDTTAAAEHILSEIDLVHATYKQLKVGCVDGAVMSDDGDLLMYVGTMQGIGWGTIYDALTNEKLYTWQETSDNVARSFISHDSLNGGVWTFSGYSRRLSLYRFTRVGIVELQASSGWYDYNVICKGGGTGGLRVIDHSNMSSNRELGGMAITSLYSFAEIFPALQERGLSLIVTAYGGYRYANFFATKDGLYNIPAGVGTPQIVVDVEKAVILETVGENGLTSVGRLTADGIYLVRSDGVYYLDSTTREQSKIPTERELLAMRVQNDFRCAVENGKLYVL